MVAQKINEKGNMKRYPQLTYPNTKLEQSQLYRILLFGSGATRVCGVISFRLDTGKFLKTFWTKSTMNLFQVTPEFERVIIQEHYLCKAYHRLYVTAREDNCLHVAPSTAIENQILRTEKKNVLVYCFKYISFMLPFSCRDSWV